MYGPKLVPDGIEGSVAALGPGPLEELSLIRHIHPLFSRVLQRQEIYLANHSLGRPLDQTAADVQQALDQWYEKMNEAWDDWLAEIQVFRRSIARLIQATREDLI